MNLVPEITKDDIASALGEKGVVGELPKVPHRILEAVPLVGVAEQTRDLAFIDFDAAGGVAELGGAEELPFDVLGRTVELVGFDLIG